jgi:rubredoxin
MYRPFNEKDASAFANARNEYLHGTEVALLPLPVEAWWSRFWSLVNVLLTAHQLVPQDLVGAARVAEVEGHLSRNAKRVEHQCEAALEAARRNLARYRDGRMLADDARRWERGGLHLGVDEAYQSEAACPACGAYGTAEGDVADDEDVVWSGDPDDMPVLEVTFTPDYFSCPVCHLVLDSYELIAQAGLNEPITIATDREYQETEYGND